MTAAFRFNTIYRNEINKKIKARMSIMVPVLNVRSLMISTAGCVAALRGLANSKPPNSLKPLASHRAPMPRTFVVT